MNFLHDLDQSSLILFRSLRLHTPGLKPFMQDVTALGGRAVLSLVVLFAVGLLLSLRRNRTAGFVLAAALGGMLISQAFKSLVGRERPPDPVVILSEPSGSFPSGHSMVSAVIYLTLALVASAVIPRWRVRAYVIGASLVLVGLIGISRLYLNVHYLTDVTAGWVVGLAWALLCRYVEFHWVARLERRMSAANGRTGRLE